MSNAALSNPSHPPPLDFTARIQKLSQGLIGREWLRRTVDDFLTQDAERTLIITGEAGLGKSAFAASLTKPELVHAHHFCVAREGGTLDPIAFVRSMSYQLSRNLPDFDAHLIEMARPQLIANVDVKEMQGGSVYGFYIDKLIVQTPSADAAFQTLIRDPLHSWTQAHSKFKPVVLLVDALDEASRLDRRPNIIDLIDGAGDLPAPVHWLLTSRPDEPHLGTLSGRRKVVLDESTENMDDVRRYVASVVEEPIVAKALRDAGIDAAQYCEECAEMSHGNFLYLHHVLKALREAAEKGEVQANHTLPEDLNGVYQEFIDRAVARKSQDEWRKVYRPVLGTLAIAQEALTLPQLSALSGVAEENTNDVIGELRPLFDITPRAGVDRYRIYHASFAEFLTDHDHNPTYWIAPATYHGKIADHYINKNTGGFDRYEKWDRYGLRYTATHLALAAQADNDSDTLRQAGRLLSLTTDALFQETHLLTLDDIAALRRDMERAVRAACGGVGSESLQLVIESALNYVAFCRERLKPEQIVALAMSGRLPAAEHRLGLYSVEPEWQQAMLLTIAWLGAARNPEEARKLRDRLAHALLPFTPLHLLLHRLDAALGIAPLSAHPLHSPAPHPEQTRLLVMAVGGSSATGIEPLVAEQEHIAEGLQASGLRIHAVDGIDSPIYIADVDSPPLVACAVAFPLEGRQILRDYIALHAANNYVHYRNRSLWGILNAVLFHPDQAWTLELVATLTVAALRYSEPQATDGLSAAITALQAQTGDANALALLAKQKTDTQTAIGAMSGVRDAGDPWAVHKRRLIALSLSYTLLDHHVEVETLLRQALDMPRGFAGFQSPACLTLAERIQVCCPHDTAFVEEALEAAHRAAHNIQDVTFCARTTARCNAMITDWWGEKFTTDIIGAVIARFVDNPAAPEFATIHFVAETYPLRTTGAERLTLPPEALEANTLPKLADLYKYPLPGFHRLNPHLPKDAPLPPQTPVRVPDPDFAPLLAARFAAETLAAPTLSKSERVRLIQQLIPLSATAPTVLDTVLSLLVLAARPTDPELLETLSNLAPEFGVSRDVVLSHMSVLTEQARM